MLESAVCSLQLDRLGGHRLDSWFRAIHEQDFSSWEDDGALLVLVLSPQSDTTDTHRQTSTKRLLRDTLLGDKAGRPDGYGYVARTDVTDD